MTLPIYRSVLACSAVALATTPFPHKADAQDAAAAPGVDIGTIVVEGTEVDTTSAGPVDGLKALTADTATGTRTPLRQVPQSVTVVPRSVIDAQGVTNASDALRNVSGVQPNNRLSTPAFDTTLIRGFAAEQFRDGLSLYQYAPGDRESLIDVERIEVVKGPSAILYGGGSGAVAGGLINFVSKMPNASPATTVGTRIGTDGAVSGYFDVNQPLSEGVLFRVTGEYTYQDHDIDVIETNRFTVSPTLQFRGDRTTLTFQGRYSSWEQQEYQGLPATGTISGPFRLDPDLFIGPSDIEDSFSRTASLTATLDHQFNDVWSAQARARISTTEFEENVQTIVGLDGFTADLPFFPPTTWGLANGELFQEQDEVTFTVSATAEFDMGRSKNTLVFGADYSKLDDEGFIDVGPFSFVDLAAPVFPPYSDPGPGVNNSFVENKTYGVYVQLQSSIDDRLHVLGSLRLARVEVDFNNATGSSSTSETRLLPRFGAVYDLTEEVSVFASYGEGIRGQPFLEFLGTAEPEESRQIEAGLKFDLAAGLSGSLAFFQIDRENVAVTDPATFLSVAEGEQRSRGFDADLIWQINPRLTLLTSYAYVDAEYTADAPTGTGVIPDGNTLAGVPEHSGRIWLDYAFGPGRYEGLGIGAGIYAQTGEFVSDNNAFKADGFYTVAAAMRYETDRYRATLALRNLTDNRYFDRYGYFDGRVFQGEGLTATASLEFTF